MTSTVRSDLKEERVILAHSFRVSMLGWLCHGSEVRQNIRILGDWSGGTQKQTEKWRPEQDRPFELYLVKPTFS